jgi:hypothetical protein
LERRQVDPRTWLLAGSGEDKTPFELLVEGRLGEVEHLVAELPIDTMFQVVPERLSLSRDDEEVSYADFAADSDEWVDTIQEEDDVER